MDRVQKTVSSQTLNNPSITATKKVEYYLPADLVSKTLSHYNQNNFVQFLYKLFTGDAVSELIRRFRIGTSKHWQGATVFYQIDCSGKVRQGKVILYDPETCKRVKDPVPRITSVHSLLHKSEEKPEYCYFGEHQLPYDRSNKPVAIVEREKTAVIMTGFFPSYIWLATGSKSTLRPSKCYSFKNRKIVLYPDLGAYNDWHKKAELFLERGFDLSVLLETKASSEDKEMGFDIADYFIKNQLSSSNSFEITQAPDTPLQKLLKKNPSLGELIRRFDCVEG